MNKADFINALQIENGLSKNEADAVVRLFFDEMAMALANGDRVEIRGLCSFHVKEYGADTVEIPRPKKRSRSNPRSCRFSSADWN